MKKQGIVVSVFAVLVAFLSVGSFVEGRFMLFLAFLGFCVAVLMVASFAGFVVDYLLGDEASLRAGCRERLAAPVWLLRVRLSASVVALAVLLWSGWIISAGMWMVYIALSLFSRECDRALVGGKA